MPRWRKHISRALTCASTLPLLMVSLCTAGALDSARCYVWDFAMRSGMKNDLTRQLTVEFEEKLTQKKICRVLERRNFARLISHKDNERAILRLEGVSTTTMDTLKAYNANAVMFGEVYDDVNSGEYKVTITLQNFDNTKSVWSTSIRRGLINDAESRQKAMGQIVKLIDDDSRSAEHEANRKRIYLQLSTLMNEYILRAENLKDAFRYLPDLAYGNKRSLEDLEKAVTAYNQVAESLKITNDALIEAVSSNWQKPEAEENTRLLLRNALDIHDTEILVFNDMLTRIRAILNHTTTDENEIEATKANIRSAVPGRVETLSARLDQLRRTATRVFETLKQ